MLRFNEFEPYYGLLSEAVSGQQSERNLVDAINKHAAIAPFKIKLGKTTHTIKSARQEGGGNPEPKADISIITSTGKEIGISMKKPNFAFLENWMNEKKLRLLLKSVDITGDPQDSLIKELKDVCKTKSTDYKDTVKKEYNTMMELMPSGEVDKIEKLTKSGSKFKLKDISISESDRELIKKALLADPKKRFEDTKGNVKTTFKVENVYRTLDDVMGAKYITFLKNVIGGTKDNKKKAQYVIVETVNKGIDLKQTISALQKAKTVAKTAEDYKNSTTVNIKFRLRPTTIARASYSKTSLGKYKKGDQFYSDDTIGISWLCFVIK